MGGDSGVAWCGGDGNAWYGERRNSVGEQVGII